MENNLNERDLYEVPATRVVEVVAEGVMVDSPTFSGFNPEQEW